MDVRRVPVLLLAACLAYLALWVNRLLRWTGWRTYDGACGHKAPCYRCGSTPTVEKLVAYLGDLPQLENLTGGKP